MHKRFRQVFCALKEHTSVSFAKIATFGGFCDVDLIIVKATAPDDLPLPEKYMHELMKMFCFSIPHHFTPFLLVSLAVLATLDPGKLLLNASFSSTACLLRSLPEDSPFRAELLWIRSDGLLSLSFHVISRTTLLQILKLTPCFISPTHNYSTKPLIVFPWTTRRRRRK
ncbi:hypothetical protein OIU77_014393 [Salix suchowensis]|uniref:Uncharacterized protein n=1 Tax=Salix suchowensis TaxID=1278906 RepID=A0ABQ8ZX36_9ROSI|nr:hypothetical protein OIU77_014393 [Salix suchowensis]